MEGWIENEPIIDGQQSCPWLSSGSWKVSYGMNIRFLSWMIFPVNETSRTRSGISHRSAEVIPVFHAGMWHQLFGVRWVHILYTVLGVNVKSTYGVASKSWFSGTSDLFRLIQTYSDLSDLEISSNLSRQKKTWCIKAKHISSYGRSILDSWTSCKSIYHGVAAGSPLQKCQSRLVYSSA